MQLDMRLGYRARLGGRRTLDIFGEVFNLTDRANFTNPGGNRRVWHGLPAATRAWWAAPASHGSRRLGLRLGF